MCSTCRYCEPCAAALLATTGSNLTRLHTRCFESRPELMDAIAGLTSLYQLQMDHLDYHSTPSFSNLRVRSCPVHAPGCYGFRFMRLRWCHD